MRVTTFDWELQFIIGILISYGDADSAAITSCAIE